jgi:hypothetical protein
MNADRRRSKARKKLLPRLSLARERRYDRADESEVEPLTRAQIREIHRRVADMDDRTRYLLVSQFTPRFALYYNVTDDMFVMNDPKGGTLFKRRKAAVAVQRLLRPSVQIVRCMSKRKNGVTVPVLPKRLRRVARRLK